MLIIGIDGVKPMIYIDKFGVLKTIDESEYFADDISEQTMEIVDDWKSIS